MAGMNDRSPVNPNQHPDLTLNPSATPGFSDHNLESRPNGSPPGFRAQPGEGIAAARSRVIDGVLDIVRQNGGSPADNK